MVFYLRILSGAAADTEPRVQWLAPDADGPGVDGTPGDAAAAHAGSGRVVMLAPSEDVLLTEVELPGRNRQRLRQALPYAMEEQLIDEVEDMSFVLGPARGGQRYSVAAVHRRRMEDWLGVAGAAGLHLDALVSDVLAIPLPEDGWAVYLEPGRVLVRTGPAAGFAATPDTAALLIEQALGEAAEAAPARIRVYDGAGTGGDYLRPGASGTEPPQVETVPHAGGLLTLARAAEAQRALSLLQGEFSPRAQLGRKLRPWVPSAALLAILLLLQPVVFFVDYRQAVRQSEQLQAQIEATFREALPGVTRVVNPRAQMDSRLKELRGRGAGAGGSFTEMLGKAGPLLARSEVQLKSLRYRGGQLDIELEAADFQRLDQLKRQLDDAGGWSIEIQSATARDDKVDGRIVIRG